MQNEMFLAYIHCPPLSGTQVKQPSDVILVGWVTGDEQESVVCSDVRISGVPQWHCADSVIH